MPVGPELRFIDRTHVVFQGKPYLFFGGTDYHRLASHPDVVAACRQEAESGGLSCAGSRITTGNNPLYERLEQKLSKFLGAEEVVLCSGGYLSNTVALEALADDYRRFFVDSDAHVSLRGAARFLSHDRVSTFRHAEPDDLSRQIRSSLHSGERPLVLTDGVAAYDGELSPLGEYWEIVRNRGGSLLVDDAHGIGTVGPGGKGSPAASRLPPVAFVQTGTLSKALGAFGGLVAGSTGLAARIIDRSQAFVGATAVPPPLAAAAIRSIEILEANPEMISALQTHTVRTRERLAAMGLVTGSSPAPIISITHRDAARNERLRLILLERGLYLPLIRDYPGSPPGGHFRLTLSSVHTDQDVTRLLEAVALSCDEADRKSRRQP
ncbi:MAG: aminotransferase class I/II-fold pyridoxal phosphate-dependent enzyme [Spirochaetia bacterium]